MNKIKIKVGFVNLDPSEMLNDVLWVVSDIFEFVEAKDPDFLIFGPYGPPPPRGNYIRIGYFCENIVPDLESCDWAFGVPYNKDISSDRYCRIEWHGVRPQQFVKDLECVRNLPIPPRFCNFVFSNPVGFREDFFRELSLYKHIDAPGKSMNNREQLDSEFKDDDRWTRKRKFLSQYKFTIAFENYSVAGYNTEKLTDPMLAGSVPIYFGNPGIAQHFVSRSFINAHDYLPSRGHCLTRLTGKLAKDKYGSVDWIPIKFQPRFRKAMRMLKIRLEYGFDFRKLVSRIVEIDQNDALYREIRSEPFVSENVPPSVDHIRNQWIKIFSSVSA